jgi:prepilin-type N-terminal cleavage/methylation domain-containing protein
MPPWRETTASTEDHGDQAAGFTLVEVIVTVTLITIGILLLGKMLLQSSRTAESAAAVSYQTAEMASTIGRLDALPFDQLVAGTTCDTVTASQLPRIRCATIADISAKVKRVTVTLTPTGSHAPPARSVVFDRSISGNGTPLNLP